MLERTDINEHFEPVIGELTNGRSAKTQSETVEQRLRRLEAAVAALQDTSLLEERILERVTVSAHSTAHAPPTGILADIHIPFVPKSVADLAGGNPEVAPQSPVAALRQTWLLFEFLAELKTFWQMLVDRRYRLTWLARVVPIVAIVIIIVSWLTLSNIWVLGPILDKLIDIILICLTYKVMSREVERYRQTTANLRARYRS